MTELPPTEFSPTELSHDDRELLAVYREVHTPSADVVARARVGVDRALDAVPAASQRFVRWMAIAGVTLLAAACLVFVFDGVRADVVAPEVENAGAQEAAYGAERESAPLEAEIGQRRRRAPKGVEVAPAEGADAGEDDPAADVVAPPEEPATTPSAKPRRPRSDKRARAADATLVAELTLLRPAQQAVRQRNFQRALTLLANHAEAFPKSALGQERALARIEALCGLGRTKEANKAAARFAKRYARSHLRERVESTCVD